MAEIVAGRTPARTVKMAFQISEESSSFARVGQRSMAFRISRINTSQVIYLGFAVRKLRLTVPRLAKTVTIMSGIVFTKQIITRANLPMIACEWRDLTSFSRFFQSCTDIVHQGRSHVI